MITNRFCRANAPVRPHAMLSLCLALIAGVFSTPLALNSASAQAIAAAPLVLNEVIRPVALSNGFVNIRERLQAARAAAQDTGDGLAPADVRRRWERGLNSRIARLEIEIAREDRGASSAWEAAVAGVRAASDPVREAQRLVYQNIRFRWDTPGQDHWQTPLETLARGAGDCEDHAVLKRELLLEAGVDADNVSLLFLRTASGTGHVVVQVETASGVRILDNRTRALRIGRLLPGDRVLAEHQTLDSSVSAGL